ncbi:hypothetical protein [Spiroplasma endosymbiont of Aspidapion aeneum]|uniref:hypothetical protein n=1 Tax=Spiroplasma endosymbiont of Aspidapion aeneum TaxID=3066276 RepID=UPI00313DE3DB
MEANSENRSIVFGKKNKRHLRRKISQEDLSIINESYNTIKQMVKIKAKDAIYYYFDVFLFILNSTLFLTLILKIDFKWVNYPDKYEKLIGYIMVFICLYFLFKFTISNFFINSSYYKDLIVYNIDYFLDRKHFNKKSIVNWQSISHIIFNLFSNITTALFIYYIINYNDKVFLNGDNLLYSIIFTVLNMVFLPSVINSIQEIRTRIINLKNLGNLVLKTQYLNNKDLFKNIVIDENQRTIYFDNIDLKSKDGVFIINKKKLISKENYEIISNVNKEIITRYSLLWDMFYKLLDVSQGTKDIKKKYRTHIKLKRASYCFSEIFFNFFE